MLKRLVITTLIALSGGDTAVEAGAREFTLPGGVATNGTAFEPSLLVREQTPEGVDRNHPVLYVHGGTFGSANSMMFRFDGISWADELNRAGLSVWAFDFAGFGGSERYPAMSEAVPPEGEPLGRADEAARQIERVALAILAETGAQKISIVAHSWGTIASGLFATRRPELVDRLVFFAPFARREGRSDAPQSLQSVKSAPRLGAWRFLTVEEQHKRFVEDVPAGHPPVLREQDFPRWAELYLASDATSRSRTPPSVKTPTGPIADVMSAWSGTLGYDASAIKSPVIIIRGEWDSYSTDADAARLLAAMASAPEKKVVRVPQATHLMHLEEGRRVLHRATVDFLTGQ